MCDTHVGYELRGSNQGAPSEQPFEHLGGAELMTTTLNTYTCNLERSAGGVTSGQRQFASGHLQAISCQVQHSSFESKPGGWDCCPSPTGNSSAL